MESKIKKTQIISLLIDLLHSLNNSVEISNCKFNAHAESEYDGELSSSFPPSQKTTGWKTFGLQIRWKNK